MKNSAVFQAGGLVACVVEVSRKAYLASIVPVIVNAILNEHQIIIDIVAFVSKGDFPRSRLGEKQRGKILAGWVTRKLRTLAQFAIRDSDSLEPDGGMDAHRASMISFRSSGIPGASSLRNMEHAPQILEQEELDSQMNRLSQLPPGTAKSERHVSGASQQPPRLDTAGASGGQRFDLPGHDDYSAHSTRRSSTLTGTPAIRLPSNDSRGPEMLEAAEGDASGEVDDWTRDAIMHMNLASKYEGKD